MEILVEEVKLRSKTLQKNIRASCKASCPQIHLENAVLHRAEGMVSNSHMTIPS